MEPKTLAEIDYSNLILDAIDAAVWVWNVQTGELHINERWAGIVGYTKEELSPISLETWNQLVHPGDLIRTNEELKKLILGETLLYRSQVRMKHKEGHYVHILDSGRIIQYDDEGKALLASGIHLDMTKEMHVERMLKERERMLSQIIENSKDLIYRMDLAGNFTFLSPAWTALMGYEVEESLGHPIKEYIHPEDHELLGAFMENLGEKRAHDAVSDYRFFTKEGSVIIFETNASPIYEEGEIVGVAGVARDISLLMKKQEQIEYLSYRDQLTGLYNRHYLEKIKGEIKERKYLPLGIVTIDLNDLKVINDTYGHHEGDELLILVSKIFKRVVKSEDLVFRMGGDEFMILSPNTSELQVHGIKKAIEEELRKMPKKPYAITVALGYASSQSEEDLFEDIKTADQYMYADKKRYKERSSC